MAGPAVVGMPGGPLRVLSLHQRTSDQAGMVREASVRPVQGATSVSPGPFKGRTKPMTMYTRYALVCRGTKGLSAVELVNKGRLHVTHLTDNPAFPDPMPSLVEIDEACDTLERASQVFEFNRGRVDKITRDDASTHLVQLLRRLAGYVQATCNGDHLLVRSTGFEVKKSRQPSEPMSAPLSVVAHRSVFPGQIDLRWSAVRNRRSYRVWITDGDPNDPTLWRVLGHTSRNHLNVEGLPSDVVHTFRVEAFGVLGYSPLSDIAAAKAG